MQILTKVSLENHPKLGETIPPGLPDDPLDDGRAPEWLGTVWQPQDQAQGGPTCSGRTGQVALVRTVGARMRQARELCNLSQVQAAALLGYANSSKLCKVEGATDGASVQLWLIVAASRIYDVSTDFLFGLTDEWETGVLRGTQAWLLDAWQKARERDLGHLDRLNARITAVATHTAALASAATEVAHGLDTYRQSNPGFDWSPASALLASRTERLADSAKAATAALGRVSQWQAPASG